MVKGASYVHKTLQTAGPLLTYAAIATDAYRLGSAALTDLSEMKQKGEVSVPTKTIKVSACGGDMFQCD